MGFDRHWLALREPADMQARDNRILSLVRNEVTNRNPGAILDIGCGTGSTYRSLDPLLDRGMRWTLLDNDQALLDEAMARHGARISCLRMDLNAIGELPLGGISLVTASALFDLCSEEFIRGICQRLSESGIALYAALNYDGRTEWSDGHPLDDTVIAAFNTHQLGDKGFGRSLGPQAWRILADLMRDAGYKVDIADSPWLLSGQQNDLQLELIRGIAGAVAEQGVLDPQELGQWHAYRHRSAQSATGICRVGHQDLFARR